MLISNKVSSHCTVSLVFSNQIHASLHNFITTFYLNYLFLPKIFLFLHKRLLMMAFYVYTRLVCIQKQKGLNIYLFVIFYTYNWHTFNK